MAMPDRLAGSSVQALLDSYPRARPKLPAGNARIYLERLHQVQRAAAVRTQADHVAGVGRDLGLNENDRRHGARIQSAPGGSVRATTQFSTRAAPARLSVPANSASDAPVVITSSTTATRSWFVSVSTE